MRHLSLTCPPGCDWWRGEGVEIRVDRLDQGLDAQARMGWTVVTVTADAAGVPRYILLRRNPPRAAMK